MRDSRLGPHRVPVPVYHPRVLLYRRIRVSDGDLYGPAGVETKERTSLSQAWHERPGERCEHAWMMEVTHTSKAHACLDARCALSRDSRGSAARVVVDRGQVPGLAHAHDKVVPL